MNKIIIQLICPDQRGIISKLTSILYETSNNILSIQQHIDKEREKFYIRLSVDINSEMKFPEKELVNYSNELKFKNYQIQWKWAFRYQWIISKI